MGIAAPAIAENVDVDVDVVNRYLVAMRGADRRTGRSTTRAARTCQAKISRAGGWTRLSVEEQIDAVRKGPLVRILADGDRPSGGRSAAAQQREAAAG
jgi:hypothetical protein